MPRLTKVDEPVNGTYTDDIDALSRTEKTSLHEMFPPPSIEAEVADRSLQSQATAHMHSLVNQMAIDAKRAGMPLEAFAMLPVEKREQLMRQRRSGTGLSEADLVQFKEADLARSGESGDVTEVARQAMKRDQMLLPEADQRSHVILCDPPVEVVVNGELRRFHPGTSKVLRKALGAKLDAGFTLEPHHDFLPDPSHPCELSTSAVFGMMGRPCEYRGRSAQEVELHMQCSHRREYAMGLERARREQQDLQLEIARAQLEATRAQMRSVEREKVLADGNG